MEDQRLSRIEAKIDDQHDHLSSIDVTLKGQAVQLEDHIARTNDLQVIVVALTRKVTLAEGAIKLLGGAAILAEIIRMFVK